MERSEAESLIHLLEERLGWGPISDWKTKDFDNLREKIQEATSVYLSVTTLKRLVGKVDYQGQPNISTLDAVATFLGYDGYRGFQQEHKPIKTSRRWMPGLNWRNQDRARIFVAVCIGLVVIGLLLSFVDMPGRKVDPALVNFNIEKVTKGIPNSVVFSYDVSGVDAKEVEIQQDWDPTKRHKVDPAKKVFTHFYEFPGYYNAKLLVNGEIIHRRDLYIPSDGWLAALSYPSDPPRYLLETEWNHSRGLQISESVANQIERKEDEVVLNYFYAIENPKSTFQDFNLRTELKYNSKSGSQACEYRRVVLLGTKMSMRIPIIYEGCISKLQLRLGSEFINGETTDLRGFGVKKQSLNLLEVRNRSNELSIYLDGNKLLTHQLKDDFGNLAGIHFAFHGAGEVQSLSLSTPSNTLVAF